jgi:thiamine-phosphate pyrophosphorylase
VNRGVNHSVNRGAILRDFDPTLYFVTDTALCGTRGVVETVRQAVDGGVTCVQVRAKDVSTAQCLALLTEVANAVGDRVPVIVDDRVDVYLAARLRGAAVHGVHVGQSDLPIDVVRALVGNDAIVGWSANTADHLDVIGRLPSDTVNYLGIGVIRATATKPDHPAPLGIDGFEQLRLLTALPCVAIGGISLDDVAALRAAGAAGAAVVSALCAAEEPRSIAASFRREWDRAA